MLVQKPPIIVLWYRSDYFKVLDLICHSIEGIKDRVVYICLEKAHPRPPHCRYLRIYEVAHIHVI